MKPARSKVSAWTDSEGVIHLTKEGANTAELRIQLKKLLEDGTLYWGYDGASSTDVINYLVANETKLKEIVRELA